VAREAQWGLIASRISVNRRFSARKTATQAHCDISIQAAMAAYQRETENWIAVVASTAEVILHKMKCHSTIMKYCEDYVRKGSRLILSIYPIFPHHHISFHTHTIIFPLVCETQSLTLRGKHRRV